MLRYAVVIEKAGDNYSAYVPDPPACIDRGLQTPADCPRQAFDLPRFQRAGLAQRREPRPVQRLTDVDVAETGDTALVEQSALQRRARARENRREPRRGEFRPQRLH